MAIVDVKMGCYAEEIIKLLVILVGSVFFKDCVVLSEVGFNLVEGEYFITLGVYIEVDAAVVVEDEVAD